MKPTAFANPGKFYRGNIHTHSTLSDGTLEPAEVCRRYKAQGYDFISLTDHFMGPFDYPIADTRPFRDDDFTTIIGAELHSGANSLGEIWHILAVGLPFDFAPSNSPGNDPLPDQETGPQIAQRAVDAGAFVAIAHPEWSGLSEADMASITAAHAVEIYNHGCEVECDRASGLHAADVLARDGKRVSFIATDDAHFAHGENDAFGGWVMVKAEANDPDMLLQALKDGAMYSSTGPDIHDIEINGDEMFVKCSPVEGVLVLGQTASTVGAFGDGLTEATLDISRLSKSPWIRIVLMGSNATKAWSNPIWRG